MTSVLPNELWDQICEAVGQPDPCPPNGTIEDTVTLNRAATTRLKDLRLVCKTLSVSAAAPLFRHQSFYVDTAHPQAALIRLRQIAATPFAKFVRDLVLVFDCTEAGSKSDKILEPTLAMRKTEEFVALAGARDAFPQLQALCFDMQRHRLARLWEASARKAAKIWGAWWRRMLVLACGGDAPPGTNTMTAVDENAKVHPTLKTLSLISWPIVYIPFQPGQLLHPLANQLKEFSLEWPRTRSPYGSDWSLEHDVQSPTDPGKWTNFSKQLSWIKRVSVNIAASRVLFPNYKPPLNFASTSLTIVQLDGLVFKARKMVKMISRNQHSLQTVRIDNCSLRQGSWQDIFDALAKCPDLREVRLSAVGYFPMTRQHYEIMAKNLYQLNHLHCGLKTYRLEDIHAFCALLRKVRAYMEKEGEWSRLMDAYASLVPFEDTATGAANLGDGSYGEEQWCELWG